MLISATNLKKNQKNRKSETVSFFRHSDNLPMEFPPSPLPLNLQAPPPQSCIEIGRTSGIFLNYHHLHQIMAYLAIHY